MSSWYPRKAEGRQGCTSKQLLQSAPGGAVCLNGSIRQDYCGKKHSRKRDMPPWHLFLAQFRSLPAWITNALTLSEQAAGAQVKLRPFTNVLVEMSLLIDGCRQFLHCTALTKPQPRLVMCQSETRVVLSYRCSNKILHTAVNVSIH